MSAPVLRVALVMCEWADMEALALRSVLERLGVRVTLYPIGRGNDLVEVLSGRDLPEGTDHLVLACHGDAEKRLVMPVLGPGVAEPGEPVGNWGAEEIRRCASLPPLLVLNTGCSLGSPAMADAFLSSGCRAYVAATGDPLGNAALFFAIRFYYELISTGCSEREAVERSRSQDADTGLYRWFGAGSDGTPLPAGTGNC